MPENKFEIGSKTLLIINPADNLQKDLNNLMNV